MKILKNIRVSSIIHGLYTWDGFDYMPCNPIGCADQSSVQDKQGTRRVAKEDGSGTEKVDYPEDMQSMQGGLKTLRNGLKKLEEIREREEKIRTFFEGMKSKKELKLKELMTCPCGRYHEEVQEKLELRKGEQYKLKLGE